MSKRRGDVVFLDELHRRDRRRRGALVPRQPQPRPVDRDRRRPRGRAHREEPGLLRPVRARPDRGDPAERGRRRDVGRAARGRSRRRSATWSSGSPSFPGSRARRPSGAARTASRPTRSASPTTSTASTTTTACSRATQQAFRLALCRATQARDRAAASASSGSRRPTGCSDRAVLGAEALRSPIARGERPDRNLALELVRVTEAAAMGAGALGRARRQERRRPGRRRRDAR